MMWWVAAAILVGLGGIAWARFIARRRRPRTVLGKAVVVGISVWLVAGLLGTVMGLIKAFGAVGGRSVDPSQQARILAEGIAEAINCTAFGLVVAVSALVALGLFLRAHKPTRTDDPSAPAPSDPTH